MAKIAGKYLYIFKCCQEKIRVFDSKIMVDHVKVNIIQHFIILPHYFVMDRQTQEKNQHVSWPFHGGDNNVSRPFQGGDINMSPDPSSGGGET